MRITKVSLVTFLVFLILQLFGVFDWSWGYVLLPLAVFIGAMCRETELEKYFKVDLTNVGAILLAVFMAGSMGCHKRDVKVIEVDKPCDKCGNKCACEKPFGDTADTAETRGQKLLLDHVKARLKHKLTSTALATKSGDKKIPSADEAVKHISDNLSDEKLLGQAKQVGAVPEGPILGLFDRLLQFISDHQEQIEALIEWALSLLKLIPLPI